MSYKAATSDASDAVTDKILFIGFDAFSHINKPVIDQLALHFKGWSIDCVALKPRLKKRKFTLALAFLAMIRELGMDFIRGDKKWLNWRNHFYSTGYMVRILSEMAQEEAEKDTYAFTFQTQSLFRTPGGRFGNFIYTDHTNLHNLRYRHIRKREYLASHRFHELEKEIYHDAATVFVMSENIRRSLIEQYGLPPEKTALVYAGAEIRPADEDTGKFHSRNIVFAGKDWQRKGGPLLLKAFEKVLKRIPDARLTILGCSPETNLSNCRVLGEVSKSEVMREFGKATVFCLPTKREPFGMVFIEAMASRLPVVCTSVGATPDLIEDGKNGFLVPYEADVLADRLVMLLENPDLARSFAEHGYRKVTEKYTWEKVGNGMAEVIRKRIPDLREPQVSDQPDAAHGID